MPAHTPIAEATGGVAPSASPTTPGQVVAAILLDWKPTLIAEGNGWVWVVSREAKLVARLDPLTNQLVGQPTILSEPIYDIVVGEGGVWLTGDSVVTRLDPETGKVAATLRADQFGDGTPFRLAVGEGMIWLLNLEQAPSQIHKIDPATNQFVGEPATAGIEALGIAFGADALWTANHDDQTVSRIDPKSNAVVASISLSWEPHYIYFNAEDGLIWVANYHANSVSRIDPRTNQLVGQPLPVPFAPEWMTSGNGKLWVLPSPWKENVLQGVESIAEFDSAAPGEAKIIALDGAPMDAVVSASSLWVTLQNPNKILRLIIK